MISPQKYEHLFDRALGEFNMKTVPISLQLMDPNCKPIHVRAYTVPRSVEKQMHQSKKVEDWWTLESLKKTIPL
jgi:hypothetical protein